MKSRRHERPEQAAPQLAARHPRKEAERSDERDDGGISLRHVTGGVMVDDVLGAVVLERLDEQDNRDHAGDRGIEPRPAKQVGVRALVEDHHPQVAHRVQGRHPPRHQQEEIGASGG